VASVNYTDDIPIGKNMLAQLAEVFRKLRNTARYMLGNLNDFDRSQDKVDYGQLGELDRFILSKLQTVVAEVTEDFDRYEFFKFYQLLQNFCVVDLSSFYFDIVKDRLYTGGKKSLSRRAVQTVLDEILQVLVRLLVPVTPHLAEDIWQHMPEKLRGKEESVLLTDFPTPRSEYKDEQLSQFWDEMIAVRYTVNKALEMARASRKIGSSLEAQVFIKVEDEALRKKVESMGENLPGFFITSQAEVINGQGPAANNGSLSEVTESGITVIVMPAQGQKCPRCWKFSTEIGKDSRFGELCPSCAEALSG
jgi:isoleucyl-tRNA synthetase